MSTAGEIIRAVLDVAKAGDNWSNLGRRPSICLVGKDRVDGCTPGDSIFIRERDGAHLQTVNRTPIFTKDTCLVRIVQSNHDDRENAFADIKVMFKNASNAIIINDYNREPTRMDLFIMELRVEVSNI